MDKKGLISKESFNNFRKFSPAASCAGCPIGLIARTVLEATEDDLVVTSATGCLEVTTTIYPNTSWKVPFIHSVFANAGATISGVETAYRSIKKRKPNFFKKPVQFVAFGGDGGTYDIGLQALSGALERGHNFLYVCYDNGAYMNTGNQRSGATPLGADTETTPFGENSWGKDSNRKDIISIVAAHHIPYIATANVAFLNDFKLKLKKAFSIKGPKFILVFSPCPNQWKFFPAETIKIAKLATETNFWPLFEIDEEKYKINYQPSKKIPVEDFYKTQGRFKHLFLRKDKEKIFDLIQTEVDKNWIKLNEKAAL